MRYAGLTPFSIRREKFSEVVNLMERINTKARRKDGLSSSDSVWWDSKGDKHIRRKAQNDNWY